MTAGERGQTTVLAIGMMVVTLAATGLAVDGTRAFLLRRSLQNAADAAALDGAAQVDVTVYHASGGTDLRLHPTVARSAVLRSLARRPLASGVDVDAGPEAVTVILRAESRTLLLALVGVTAVPVAVEARATPLQGAVPRL